MAFNFTNADQVDASPMPALTLAQAGNTGAEYLFQLVNSDLLAFNTSELNITNIVDVADRSRGRCLAALETKVKTTVFHFEPHQSVLGPEYFGYLQSLADHVSICPGVTVVLNAVGEHRQTNSSLRQKREESVLRILDRKGYDMSQFRAGHRAEEASLVRASYLDGGGNGGGYIKFTVRQTVSAQPIQEERIGQLSQ